MKNKKKYVVLSFDDARDNFYLNAFPVLEKYGVKCTLNVITGLIDKTVKSNEFVSCTKDQILEIQSRGHEIASHSNSHIAEETIDDMVTSIEKIKEYFNVEVAGCAMPFNQSISQEMMNALREKGIMYVRVGYKSSKTNILKAFYSIMYKLFRKDYFYKKMISFSCFKTTKYKNEKKPYVFYSVNVGSFDSVHSIINFLRKRKNESVTILMLHSILKTKEQIAKDSYPRGCILADELETLLGFLKSNDSFNVIRNDEVVSIIGRK